MGRDGRRCGPDIGAVDMAGGAGALQPITLTTEERALLRSGLRRLADERAKPLPSFFRREGVEPPGHYSEVGGQMVALRIVGSHYCVACHGILAT